jgi:DNA-binding NarL/FixJ family response regulator
MAIEEQSGIDLTETLLRVGVPACIAARDGRVTWINEAARSVFGDIEGAVFGGGTIAPEHVPHAVRQFGRKLNGVAVTEYEIDVITRDGSRVPARVSSVRIRGDDPERAVFAIALLDRNSSPSEKRELTPRQNEVLQLLAKGASTHQMAAELHLTTETVRNHIRRLLAALGAHSRLEAVAVARLHGLIRE